MIETIICDYLTGQDLEGVGGHVYLEVPLDPPAAYIVIEKTSSGVRDHIRSALMAVQSISKNSLHEAAVINEAVIEAMEAFADNSGEIYSCRLNSDYNFTDPETREYRYQAVFNLYY